MVYVIVSSFSILLFIFKITVLGSLCRIVCIHLRLGKYKYKVSHLFCEGETVFKQAYYTEYVHNSTRWLECCCTLIPPGER